MIPWIKSAAVFTAVAAICAVTAGGAGAAGSNAPSASTTRSAASTAAATRAALLRHADFSTIAGAKSYFRSIGVNPRGVVIQRGARNYAGPRCPGPGWACTRATHPVVQIAAAGGTNRFVCRTAHCAVVQLTRRAATTRLSLAAPAAKPNKAVCIKTTGLTQSCSISQSSGMADNTAVVYQNAGKLKGLTQTASSSASITQQATGSANTNTACVLQATTIDGTTVAKKGMPVTVTLESHQSVTITQNSSNGGNSAQDSANSSGMCVAADPLMQTQTLSSTATGSGAITQNQNAASNGPNVLLDIEQNQGTGFFGSAEGPNDVDFKQTNSLTAIANTSSPVGPVSQTQSSSTGGIQAMVNQDSFGISTAIAYQKETQCEDAFAQATTPTTCDIDNQDPPGYSLTQTQFGPIGNTGAPTPTGQRTPMKVTKGPCPPDCATQTGNDDDTFTITQITQQDNDTGQNQTNTVQADCTTDGNCTVSQTATVNGETTTNTESGKDVNTQTNCTGSACTTSGTPTSGTLTLTPTGFSVSNTDVAEFGTGGMRGGDGTGTISVSGVTAPVLHALLFWHGPTNSGDPAANAAVTFAGTPITGTNIGVDSDNNWGFENSQAYRADVTGLVTGNGSYALANFTKPGVDINGVSLLVFYDDGNSSNDRNVVAWNGNDSNVFDGESAEWDETILGVPYPDSGNASLDLIVGDGQSYADGEVDVNGSQIAPAGAVFQGEVGPNYGGNPDGVTGSLWDMNSYDITSLLIPGSNTLHITSLADEDALSLVVAIANVSVSGQPIILAAPTVAVAPVTSTPTRAHSRSANRRGALR
jgi:hypothetical protein